ncbi:MAG: hypothetical protein K6T83_03225 [Alicyclobacillus sp.]|nr:hypothetical protein [Alicyclobacillus sp.]
MKTNHIDPALRRRAEIEHNNPYGNQPFAFLAKVIAVHPDTGTVDVAFDGTPYQGGIHTNIPICTWNYGTKTGQTYLPGNIKLAAPIPSSQGPYDQPVSSGEQDVWAVILHLGGRAQRPVCIGFKSSLDSMIHTKDAGWQVSLHESGVWSIISPTGDVETGLPDGSTILLSTGTQPIDMTEQNPEWNPKTTSTPYNVTLNIKGNVNITVNGSATVNASQVYLGTTEGGGAAVARVGDTVNLTTGVIESGSSKVFAG